MDEKVNLWMKQPKLWKIKNTSLGTITRPLKFKKITVADFKKENEDLNITQPTSTKVIVKTYDIKFPW
jgi:hypothetical protein